MVVVLTMVNSFTTPSLVSLLNLHSLLLEANSHSLNFLHCRTTTRLNLQTIVHTIFHSLLLWFSYVNSLVGPSSTLRLILSFILAYFSICYPSYFFSLNPHGLSFSSGKITSPMIVHLISHIARSIRHSIHNSPLHYTHNFPSSEFSLWFLATHSFSLALLFSIDQHSIHRR